MMKVYVLHYREEYTHGFCRKIIGVFVTEAAARQEIEQICATPEAKIRFLDTFVNPPCYPGPKDICPDHFIVEPFDLLPALDDWVDGHPDAWDFEAVLRENKVQVEWCDKVVDGCGTVHRAGEYAGWSMTWKHGVMFIGPVSETIARKAAALFVSLWLRGLSASFADKLMDGFIMFLELQDGTRLTFLAEIDVGDMSGQRYFRLTREGLCTREPFADNAEKRIIAALDQQPDEEVIVTFAKRKKS